MKTLAKVNTSVMSEDSTRQLASVFFVEVSSNVYLLKKHRQSNCIGKYVDGGCVAKELNTNFNVAIKKLNGDLMANFTRESRREFLANTINREII
jgi:hypothetical protein